MQQPKHQPAGIEYARSQSRVPLWRRKRIRFLALAGLVIVLLAATTKTTRRFAFVNYSTGIIRNRLCVFGVPVHTVDRPIFESSRGSQEAGSWRLLTKEGVFRTAKEETIDTSIMSDLQMVLQAITILGNKISDAHKRELSQAAWDAAAAGDSRAIRAIRIQAEREKQIDADAAPKADAGQ